MKPAVHQYEDKLLEFAYGELPRQEAEAVDAHVRNCPRCSDALSQITSVRSAMQKLPAEPAPEAGLESLLAYAEQTAKRNAQGQAKPTWWRRFLVPAMSVAAVVAVVGVVSNRMLEEHRVDPVARALEQERAKEASEAKAAAPAAVPADVQVQAAQPQAEPEQLDQGAQAPARDEAGAKLEEKKTELAANVPADAPEASEGNKALNEKERLAGELAQGNYSDGVRKGKDVGRPEAKPAPQKVATKAPAKPVAAKPAATKAPAEEPAGGLMGLAKSDRSRLDADQGAGLGGLSTAPGTRGGSTGDLSTSERVSLSKRQGPVKKGKLSKTESYWEEKAVPQTKNVDTLAADTRAKDKAPPLGLSQAKPNEPAPVREQEKAGKKQADSFDDSVAQQQEAPAQAYRSVAPAAQPAPPPAPVVATARPPSKEPAKDAWGLGSSSSSAPPPQAVGSSATLGTPAPRKSLDVGLRSAPGGRGVPTAAEEDAAAGSVETVIDRKKADNDEEFARRQRVQKAHDLVTQARKTNDSGDRRTAIKQALEALNWQPQGQDRMEALNLLCGAYEAMGEHGAADPFCDALLTEFPTSRYAQDLTQRRNAMQRAPAPKAAEKRKAAPADYESPAEQQRPEPASRPAQSY